MLKNLSIGRRVLIGSGLVIVLTIGLILPIALSKLAAISDRAELRELEDHYDALTSAIASKGEEAQALSAAIAQIPEIQQAFAQDDRERLKAMTRPIFDYIRNKIERVQTGSATVVQAIGKSEERAGESIEHARRASESFKSISRSVTAVNDMNTQIASAAEEQSAVAEEINRNVHAITEAVHQTASGSEHLAQASEELARLAADIQLQIGHCKV
ncbi:cache domain-containing protein [Thiorhodococcus minor]|uniref:cache domain-containing protein n=1 Tax=Thiorhodococcus minor TaxID=57489 RepID=UPI001ADB60A7|nr:cache domain-containing protein [Thiorhodococcus minor]